MKKRFLFIFLFSALVLPFFLPQKSSCWGISPNDKWQEYINSAMGFKFFYPIYARIKKENNLLRIDLSVNKGTNLIQKYILISISNKKQAHLSSLYIEPPKEVSINGVNFTKVIWEEGTAGSTYYVLQYSSSYLGRYIEIKGILRMLNTGVLDKKVKPVDLQREIALLKEIINSFQILPQNDPSPRAKISYNILSRIWLSDNYYITANI